MTVTPLYRPIELAYRTLYAELKERVTSLPALLPGTAGGLTKRTNNGNSYWYRSYSRIANRSVEDYVCRADDADAYEAAVDAVESAQWVAKQVRRLRLLDFQVASKDVALVLVELFNESILGSGLVLVGTLAYMAWLNELGVESRSLLTLDVDLASRAPLRLAGPQRSFLDILAATKLDFVAIPGMPSDAPPTSAKLKGAQGLRVDILVHGPRLGTAVATPSLQWHAQAVPYFDYLLDQPRLGTLLAGTHSIPVLLPRPERMAWHKLYASGNATREASKRTKDIVQAATLLAVLVEQYNEPLAESFAEIPAGMRMAIKKASPLLAARLEGHPAVLEELKGLDS